MLQKLSDRTLYYKIRHAGKNALKWRNRFIGMLPEAHRRRLWEKRGFSSVFEFAKKLAGLSEEQVRRTLNIEKRFQNKPQLHNLLTTGQVSINKLARIASIATEDNEAELAVQVQILPKSAVETLVRDFRSNKPNIEAKSVPGQTIELSDKVKEKLNEIQAKGLNVNQILLDLLEKREQEIQSQKAEIAEDLAQTNSRYIPARVRNILKEEHGDRCSVPQCERLAEHLHHTNLFSMSHKHDPRFIAPLCKDHHDIAHSINQKKHVKQLSTTSYLL